MPPITSSRPGARDTVSDAPRSNSARARKVSRNAVKAFRETGRNAVKAFRETGRNASSSATTSDPPSGAQRLLKQRLHLRADVRVGVARPRDFCLDVERRVQRLAVRIGDDHAAFLRDERGADVVRV